MGIFSQFFPLKLVYFWTKMIKNIHIWVFFPLHLCQLLRIINGSKLLVIKISFEHFDFWIKITLFRTHNLWNSTTELTIMTVWIWGCKIQGWNVLQPFLSALATDPSTSNGVSIQDFATSNSYHSINSWPGWSGL